MSHFWSFCNTICTEIEKKSAIFCTLHFKWSSRICPIFRAFTMQFVLKCRKKVQFLCTKVFRMKSLYVPFFSTFQLTLYWKLQKKCNFCAHSFSGVTCICPIFGASTIQFVLKCSKKVQFLCRSICLCGWSSDGSAVYVPLFRQKCTKIE